LEERTKLESLFDKMEKMRDSHRRQLTACEDSTRGYYQAKFSDQYRPVIEALEKETSARQELEGKLSKQNNGNIFRGASSHLAVAASSGQDSISFPDASQTLSGTSIKFQEFLNDSFKGDYLSLHRNLDFKALMIQRGDRRLLFSDYVVKYGRKGKPSKRVMVLTDRSVFLLNIQGQLVEIKRHIGIHTLQSVSLSRLMGDILAFHTGVMDTLIRVSKRVEVMQILIRINEFNIKTSLAFSFGERIYIAQGQQIRPVYIANTEELKFGAPMEYTVVRLS
jgi:hypothetical protein